MSNIKLRQLSGKKSYMSEEKQSSIVLYLGDVFLEVPDNNDEFCKLKLGDGKHQYKDLPYVGDNTKEIEEMKEELNSMKDQVSYIRKSVVMAILAIISICVILMFTGCSIEGDITELKGSITGNEYNIDTFDNYDNLTLKTHGEKIEISPNVVTDRVYNNTNGDWETVESESSVISISIDGKDMESCGDTCIFYDTSLEPDYDFTLDTIESNSTNVLDNPVFAKSLNRIKNVLGKSRVVVIKSQMGTPIYAFSGDDIYWKIDDSLPKFTKIFVDKRPLYIHRANFQIIDTDLIDSEE